MRVGEVLRIERERRGWSLSELAAQTNLSSGHLSRIESGQREPSWATLCLIASVWGLEPLVHLVSPRAERQSKAAAFDHFDPDERLARQNPAVFDAAIILMTHVTDAVLTGAVAAVLQGVAVDVRLLDAIVPDDDVAIEQLIRLMLRSYCLYEELSPDTFRAIARTEWVVGRADAVIRINARLPITLPMSLDGVPARVVALSHLLATDPVIADAAGALPPDCA